MTVFGVNGVTLALVPKAADMESYPESNGSADRNCAPRFSEESAIT